MKYNKNSSVCKAVFRGWKITDYQKTILEKRKRDRPKTTWISGTQKAMSERYPCSEYLAQEGIETETGTHWAQ